MLKIKFIKKNVNILTNEKTVYATNGIFIRSTRKIGEKVVVGAKYLSTFPKIIQMNKSWNIKTDEY